MLEVSGMLLQPMAYNNNLITKVERGLRFNVGKEEPRFGSGGDRLHLMGCALHYVLPRDVEMGTRGEVQDQEIG
jgi:hypothetical protein